MSRRRTRQMDKHHLKARSLGGTNDPSNISIVDKKQHRSFHNLFIRTEPEKIAEVLNTTWLDPDWCLIAVKKDTVKGIQKLIRQLT